MQQSEQPVAAEVRFQRHLSIDTSEKKMREPGSEEAGRQVPASSDAPDAVVMRMGSTCGARLESVIEDHQFDLVR